MIKEILKGMGHMADCINKLTGNTPVLELKRAKEKYGLCANVFAKLEYFNPAGSVKDRVANEMISDMERSGKLVKGGTIIEPTSGNTGIGLACIAAAKGYKVIVVMPESMSIERRKLIAAYGAEIVLTSAQEGMSGSIKKANELQKEIPDSVIAGQFENSANPAAHYKTTGPEIWNDTEGKVDIFVSAVGTGGTITGTGKYLKEKNENIKVVAVEPASSAVLSGGVAGPHKIQGIGAGFIPEVLDVSVIDEIICVSNEDAITEAREIPKTEGILVGISSGSALHAAFELAKRTENKDKNIVVILPDTGERYLSTELFS